jgi:CheY-like chemotaxis protein
MSSAATPMISEREILKARILVVDDNASNVQLMKQMLVDWGYLDVQSTLDGSSVCSMHLANHYDLILLDLQMPVMDGFEVMQALVNSKLDPHLCVIVITAQPEHKLRALSMGARDFISKPFDFIEVKTRIHNMLEARMLTLKLADFSIALSNMVEQRTLQLRDSEARYKSLAELVADWYWEQDNLGNFVRIFGPVREMLGIKEEASIGDVEPVIACVWNETERQQVRSFIDSKQPFHDFVFGRTNYDGTRQYFRVSGEPMFDPACRYIGYRGVGVEAAGRS